MSQNWQFEDVVTNSEGQVDDMTSSESVEVNAVEENSNAKRGRGRPLGATKKPSGSATNRSNDLDSLEAQITELRSLVQSQNIKIMNLENRAPSVNFNGPELPPNLEQRLDIIQRWVEALHTFLNTGRITNSIDGAVEEELELIISKIPEIPSNA